MKKILWLTWKDRKHPTAGGAELVNEEIAKRLVQKGHKVKFLVRGFQDSEQSTTRHGFEVVYLNPSGLFPLVSALYYLRHLRNWPDIIVEEVNTIPYLSKFYAKQPVLLFYHQLAGEVLSYLQPFPLNRLGQLAEKTYLRLINNLPAVTVSPSTKKDLVLHGFDSNKVKIIPEGITLESLENLPPLRKIKTPYPTILFLGTLRSMKRAEDVVKAFEIIKHQVPSTRLWLAGAPGPNRYHQKLMQQIKNSPYANNITYHNRVSKDKKIKLLQKADLLAATSVKEGWGLVVTEANSQGTPAVGYNVDGLRDSIRHQETGLLTPKNTPKALAKTILKLLKDEKLYKNLRHNAWQWSKEFNFDHSATEFEKVITRYV